MVEENSSPTLRVLHVAPDSSPISRQICGILAAAEFSVVTCSDVYRAMARIGRLGREAELMVVACLDRMTANQMEFFPILSRRYKRCCVYVYGGEGSRAKLDAAVAGGAEELADVDVLSLELESWQVDARPNPDSAGQQREPIERSVTEADVRAAAADAKAEDEPRGPARVPWLKYSDGPLRTPPGRQTEPDDTDDDSQERLLSAEELDALIGPNEAENGTDG